MTLCDTGPLVALIDPDQGDIHTRCVQALLQITAPLVVTWPVITEAMYFAHKLGGWPMQTLLWRHLRTPEAYRLHMPQQAEIDASLVGAAETLRIRRVFTLDSHFRFYRTRDGGSFELFPA